MVKNYVVLTLYKRKNFGPVRIESFCRQQNKYMMKVDLGRVASIFSFSHNVFKSFLSQGSQISGLCGKELTDRVDQCLTSQNMQTCM